ncbi:MAG: LCP family protein [Ilumatobacteraceae bacterium]
MLAVDTTPLRRPRRWVHVAVVALLVAIAVAAGVVAAARSTVADVARVADVEGVLDPAGGPVEVFLLVGSDSRSAGDPNTGDSGDASGVEGSRSDSIILLRRDRSTGEATLLSIPRDLYVEIVGHSGRHRINAAYNDGPATLVRTIQQSLGLPVHHYVEVDFSGLVSLVDAVGGVEVCFEYPARDAHTGLDIRNAGCHVLDGRGALAYTRSRYFEELIDGVWHRDPTSDLGRAARQRAFVDATLARAFDAVLDDPFHTGQVARAVLSAVRIDPSLDPLVAAGTLRPALLGGLGSITLPVVPVTVDGEAVLERDDRADALGAWFRGDGPRPVGV